MLIHFDKQQNEHHEVPSAAISAIYGAAFAGSSGAYASDY